LDNMLVKERRGEIVENVVRGSVCVVGYDGEPIARTGDIDRTTYFRSALKPLQALLVLMSGMPQRRGFTREETAIMAASHAGEEIHLHCILSMLKKAGYEENDLIMNPEYPVAQKDHDDMAAHGIPPRKALHNCSGNHIGIMLLSEHLNASHKNYYLPDNPAQKEILRITSVMSEYREENIKTGTDGCGIPTLAVPLVNMAVSYLNLACPERLMDECLADAARLMAELMNEYPKMIRGTGYMCEVLNADRNIAAKSGSAGVYCLGLKKERIGLALKLEDGSHKYRAFIIAEALRQLGYSNLATIEKLDALSVKDIMNDTGDIVGRAETCFKL